MQRRTIAMGIAAVVAVALAVIVTVANGRRTTSPEYDAAAAYIKSVDTLQQRMQVQMTKATKAYRDFSGGKIKASLAPELARAERTMLTLERRLDSLQAPDVARRLHRLLVKLADAEVALAGEVHGLAVFTPRFGRILQSASVAGSELSKALGAVDPPTAHTIHGTRKQIDAARAKFVTEATHAASLQADAVDAYCTKIGLVRTRLLRLRPPLVMKPAYTTQLRTLTSTRRAGTALASELRKADRAQIAVFGRRFSIAARGATTVGAQKAEIAAVKAYNRRVRAIGAIQASVQTELARLQRTIG